MSSFRALPREEDEDEPPDNVLDPTKEALLPREEPAQPASRPKGWRPLTLLVVLASLVFGLLALFKLFPGLRTPFSSSTKPTSGLDPEGAAYAAAVGPWAAPGDAWRSGGSEAVSLDAGQQAGLLSNGTHEWRRTVLLVSLDGVRADYLTRGLTPNLLDIADQGLRAEYMESVFPTLTFPNHWSIMTGLYAESHGIVGNDFIDPATGKSFHYTDPARSWSPEWWGGEPVWATAERQGVKSAVLMWPGPPQMASGVRPTRWYAFEDHRHWSMKTSRIESWLDLPLDERPQFIAAYLPEVDQEGHRTGPTSDQVADRLRYVDDFAKSIHDALAARQLHDIVDVFYVSDHGMTETSNDKLIFLDDLLGDDYAHLTSREGWPSAGLRFDSTVDTERLLHHLREESAESGGAFQVFSNDMPSEWHFNHAVNDRIAPIYLVPDNGWSITHHEELAALNGTYAPLGNHGYDPKHPDMRAIFVAHGPWARKAPQRTLPSFDNVEVYNLVTGLLGVEPAVNNGTGGFWETYA